MFFLLPTYYSCKKITDFQQTHINMQRIFMFTKRYQKTNIDAMQKKHDV